jgi:hypothetical protein
MAALAEAAGVEVEVAVAPAPATAAAAAAAAPAADGFADYDSGTYGAVSYNRATGEIRKTMHMYALADCGKKRDPRYVEYSTICELATYAAAAGTIAGVPEMRRADFAWDKGKALLYFPYAGTTLHHWIRNNLLARRRSCALHILRGLAQIALPLAERGIQNTDTKPANILIHETPTDPDMFAVSLIDFNLVSMRTGRAPGGAGGAGSGEWSASFGTWCYCAPELLNDGAPHDKSPVWTLGVILACILYKFPYEGYSSLKTDQLNSQKFWKNAFAKLRADDPLHLPLPAAHRQHFTPYMTSVYKRCTAWDPNGRPSLGELLAELTDVLGQGALMHRPVFPGEALRSRSRRGTGDSVAGAAAPEWTPLKPRRKRQLLLRSFRRAYEKNADEMPEYAFVAAALYVDRVATEAGAGAAPIDQKEVGRLAGASMHVALAYYAQYIYEYAKMPVTHALFADKDAAWKLGIALKWRLLIPVRVMEAATADPEAFYEALLQRRKPYSDDDLCRDIKETSERLASLSGISGSAASSNASAD